MRPKSQNPREKFLTGSRSVFASNWIFGHSLGLCYNRKIGTFFVYMTDPKYRLDIETGKGVLVISPLDRADLSSALAGSGELQRL